MCTYSFFLVIFILSVFMNIGRLIDGHTGCFHVFVIVKCAAINTGVHGCLSYSRIISSGSIPRNRIACSPPEAVGSKDLVSGIPVFLSALMMLMGMLCLSVQLTTVKTNTYFISNKTHSLI